MKCFAIFLDLGVFQPYVAGGQIWVQDPEGDEAFRLPALWLR